MLPSLGLVKFPTWRVRRSAESMMGSSILGWSAAPPRGHDGRRLDQGLRSDVFGHKIGVLPQAIAGPLDLALPLFAWIMPPGEHAGGAGRSWRDHTSVA